MNVKKFSADLPETVVDRFDQFVRDKGLLKRRAIMAALDFIRAAPPELRDLLMAEDISGAAEWMKTVNKALPSDMPNAFRVDMFQEDPRITGKPSGHKGSGEAGLKDNGEVDPKAARRELTDAGDRAARKPGGTRSRPA